MTENIYLCSETSKREWNFYKSPINQNDFDKGRRHDSR